MPDPIYPRKFMHSPTTTMTEKVANSSNIVAVMNYACTFSLVVCFYSAIPVHSFGSFCIMEDFNTVIDIQLPYDQSVGNYINIKINILYEETSLHLRMVILFLD
jgi:hypothetical protein